MKDYLKFVDANLWDKELRFGIFKYGEDKIICKFFLEEGVCKDYFVTSTRTENMEKLYSSKKFSQMSKKKITQNFGEEFYERYKSGTLTIKYLRNIEKNISSKVRKVLAELDTIDLEDSKI